MTRRRSQRGSSYVEVVVALGIGALLISVLGSISSVMAWLPSNRGDQITVMEDLQVAQHWITRDANAATTWTAGTSPNYGTFSWTDYTPSSTTAYLITYSYDAANGYLMRTEQRNSATYASFAAAKYIAGEGDASFAWNPSSYSVQVSLTSTRVTGTVKEGVASLTQSATIMAALRPRAEAMVSPPGSEPVPTPLPGSVTYQVAANPTLLTGSYVSGGAAQLAAADGSDYVADSGSGSPKRVIYTVAGQSMTLPATISQVEVRFVGKSSAQNVILSLYVQDSAAGYPGLADTAFTFTSASEYRTHTLYLNPTALAYVNSLPSRVVNLKVAAEGNAAFTLSTDQIIFVASP